MLFWKSTVLSASSAPRSRAEPVRMPVLILPPKVSVVPVAFRLTTRFPPYAANPPLPPN
jgi:hypothetical protein